MDLVCTFQIFPIGQLYHVNLYYIDILNWLLMSNNSFVQKIYTKFTIIIYLLGVIWNFWASGFSKNGFNSMLNLGLYFLRVVWYFKIYTEFVTWNFPQNYHVFYLTLYIYLCLLLTSLLYGVIFLHYYSWRFYKIIGDASPLSNTI